MKLYVFTMDCGDGSTVIQYSFDPDYLMKFETAACDGEEGSEYYWEAYRMNEAISSINVPDDSTAESLGVTLCVAGDWKD